MAGGGDQLARDDPVGDHPAVGVDVGQERLQGTDPLGDAGVDDVPVVGRDDPGHHVQRERSLDATDVEGHSGLGVVVRERLGDRPQLVRGRPTQRLVHRRVRRADIAVGVDHLVERGTRFVTREDVLHGWSVLNPSLPRGKRCRTALRGAPLPLAGAQPARSRRTRRPRADPGPSGEARPAAGGRARGVPGVGAADARAARRPGRVGAPGDRRGDRGRGLGRRSGGVHPQHRQAVLRHPAGGSVAGRLRHPAAGDAVAGRGGRGVPGGLEGRRRPRRLRQRDRSGDLLPARRAVGARAASGRWPPRRCGRCRPCTTSCPTRTGYASATPT